MVAKMRGRKIKTEKEFKNWFEKNFKKLGYSKVIKKDSGEFPDYIMLKGNKELGVELETLLSNFILHKHKENLVDEIVCIEKDINLKVPIKEIKELNFVGNKQRVSATIDKSTLNKVEFLIKNSNFRNKSHVIEAAIKLLAKEEIKR